jgi:hypothetical protein
MKLQAIENALIAINDAVFQNLCDAFLFLEDPLFNEIHRIGSVKGKQKTSKGRPDALFSLSNGKYIFAEYTTTDGTNKPKFFKKLEKDLKDCFDETQTKIKVAKIGKIILCYNTTLDTESIERLRQIANDNNVPLRLVGLDVLAINLFGNYKHLAKEFLGISIDTGQILAPKLFVKEYRKANLATPLSTKFLYRDDEKKKLLHSLEKSEIVVLTGSAGVGKSRLALEGLSQFKKKHPSYNLYCITSKNASILDDLRTYLINGKDYLLMIDDANRQLHNFLTLLATFREEWHGKIKILITVRDYARNDILNRCRQYDPSILIIKKMEAEEILSIIQSEFKIIDPAVSSRIIKIANGNPRLAIMAAIIYPQKGWAALEDVSSLYDEYFQTFVDDETVFNDVLFIKTLGIISFFHAIDLSNKEFVQNITDLFNIDYYEFVEMIYKIEALELIDVYYNETLKITEQVLSTYFFYSAFIKKKLLDIEILFHNFFHTHSRRFKDTLLAATDTFGVANVIHPINTKIENYWDAIKDDREKALLFLEVFSNVKTDTVFGFAYNEIEKVKVAKNSSFVNDINYYKLPDQLLNILQSFFAMSTDDFATALDLSIEYVKRYPNLYPDLVKHLIDQVYFSKKDEENDFFRQIKLLDHLIGNGKIANSLFYDLFNSFMSMSFLNSTVVQNVTNFSDYVPSIHPNIKKFRERLWNSLTKKFSVDFDRSFLILLNYVNKIDSSGDIHLVDFPFVILIIQKYFSPKQFSHCYLVNRYLNALRKNNIANSNLFILKDRFTTTTYKLYLFWIGHT